MTTRLRSGRGRRVNYRRLAGLTTVVRRRVTAKLSKPIARAVKKIVGRTEEVKHVGQNVVNAAFNQTISSTGELYPVMPAITEGTDGHQRIGDKIRGKYLIVKGHVQYDRSITDEYMPPNTIRLMILTQRNIKAPAQISTLGDYSHLLKDNVGTDVGRPYGGNMFDNLAPLNKDVFTVLMDKKVKFREHIVAGLGITGFAQTQGTQRTFTFTKKIKVPATLHFDDVNGDSPNNFAPFFCMGGVSDDNSGAISVNTPYRCTIQSELYFTDA